jgi:lactoylglutathione lyase
LIVENSWGADVHRDRKRTIFIREIRFVENISKISRRGFMNEESSVKDLSFRVHHTMLPVADLDRSIAFYTRLLGMKVNERHASEARRVKVGLIGYGEEARAPFLELIQDTSARAPVQVTPANIHIGIDTSDLRKLCAILEKEGVGFIRPFKQRSDGMGFSAWIRDPDGHDLELAERHPHT